MTAPRHGRGANRTARGADTEARTLVLIDSPRCDTSKHYVVCDI